MIREFEKNDICGVVSIYNYYIANTIVSFEEEPVSHNEMKERIDTVISAGFPWLVAVEDGEIVGYAYANQWNARSAYKYSAEVSVYLSHLSVAMGWGTRLYNELFNLLKKKSIRTVIGGVSLPNPASVALHEKFGMVQAAHFKEVGFKYKQWIDVGYWQGELKT